MARRNLGRQTSRFERRYGAELGPPLGLNTDTDPSSVPPNQFVQLQNARWKGNDIVPRGGQEKINATVLHDAAAAVHPFDLQFGAPASLWMCGTGCPGQSASTGFFLAFYDPDACPELQRLAYYDSATLGIAFGWYSGEPYACIDGQLRRVTLTPIPWGSEAIEIMSSPTLPLATLPSGFFCRSMIEFDGYLFLACEDGASAGKVMRWDGTSLQEDLTGVEQCLALGLWRDQLVLGLDASANEIQVRAAGETPSWSAVAPGAGTVSAQPGNCSIVSFKDEVYIASGAAALWHYDGTTLSAVHTPSSSTAVTAVAVAFGYLYYGYTATNALLGRTADGAVFTDAHKNLTAQLATATAVQGLAPFRGSLAAGLTPSAAAPNVAISPLDDTAGTWDLVEFEGTQAAPLFYMVAA